MIDRLLAGIAALVEKRPRLVAVALLLVTAGAGVGLAHFEIDSDYGSFLPDGVEPKERDSRLLFVIVRGDQVESAAARLRASPLVAEVRATREELLGERLEQFRRAPLYYLPEKSLDRLAERLTTGRRAALAEMQRSLTEDPIAGRELALRDPLGVRWIFREAGARGLPDALDPKSPYLVTVDGRTGFLVVRGKQDPFDLDYSLALLEDLETRVDADFFGGYVIARADSTRMRRDMIVASSMSIALVLLFLWRSTRSFRAAHFLLVPTVCAILWTLGYGSLALGPLNPLVVSAAAVLTGLGVDFAIHFAGRLAEEHGDVARATRTTGRALLLGMLTGVAAFLSLLFGQFSGMRTFGILLSFGLVSAFFATLLMLPLLLRWAPLPSEPGPVIRYFDRLSRSRSSKPIAWLMIALGFAGWLVVAGEGLTVDADPRHFRPADDPMMATQRRFEKELGFSPEPIRVTPTRPFVRQRAAVAGLMSHGTITSSAGPHKTTARKKVDAFRERIRGWRDGSAADLEALGLNPKPFRFALEDLDRRLHTDADLSGPILLFVPHALWGTEERRVMHNRIKCAFGGDTVIDDPYALADQIRGPLRNELGQAFLIAVGAVVLIVLVFMRSPLALLPVWVGFGITLGVVAAAGVAIHPGNFVALPFLLGLGVDDGIHMVGRAREGRGNALLTAGQGVWRTSATTLLAFGSLAFASTPAFASLGVILAIGIVACFLASVVVLPAFQR